MRIEMALQGDFRAALGDVAGGLKAAIDAGTLKAVNETRDFGRVVMRQALGPRAANTLGSRTFQDSGAAGIFTRWLHDGESVPYGFTIGATIRPTTRQFLAIPTDDVMAGILPPSLYQPGQLPALGRRPIITTQPGARQTAGVRLSPKTFEYKTGVRLRYVPPMGGRRFGMLVVDSARLSPKGQVRGSKRKTPRYTYVAFILLPQTKLPQQLKWQPVVDYGADRLEIDVLDAVQTSVDGGVPQYTVRAG